MSATEHIAGSGNRYDQRELGGAFGDLGTLVPFLAAYIAILNMDAVAILLSAGAAMIVVGLLYHTPFPVQPMKAIGAVAIGQGAAAGLTGSAVVGAGLVTGLVWLILGATGMAKRAADLVPRPALLGVILGLGFSFMLEGIRMMSGSPWLAWPLLALTLVMLSRSAVSRAPTKSTASSFSQPPRLPSGTSALPSSSAFSAITHRSADGSIPKLE